MHKLKFFGWWLSSQILYALAFPFLFVGEWVWKGAEACKDAAVKLDSPAYLARVSMSRDDD